jgi:glycosyltransferase involved in cell wall biosynthesis
MTAPYSVAIVHYHLHRGGVTRVIHTASRCLTAAGVPHVILSGDADESGAKLPVHVVEGLGYGTEPGGVTGIQLVKAMRSAASAVLGPGPIVWHFHNHSLGRNRAMADAVAIMAETGDAMILQFHDFAEDGRSQNYEVIADAETLYPHSARIRYAFINSRDRGSLISAGLPSARAALVPNAITAPAAVKPPGEAPASPLVLYPVRGIRRKNLGELFLLAALSPKGTRYAVTLGPDNVRWQAVHDEWKAFADDTGLPVMLDVVGRLSPAPKAPRSFAGWLRHSTHCITTSVAEGFGLGFLEPAAMGVPLLGRNLPSVTNDFAEAGIVPGRLYDRLLVPVAWVGMETLRQRLIRSLRATLEAYGQAMSNEHLERTFAAMLHKGNLDFGNLPEDLQRQVIHRVLAGKDSDAVLVEARAETQPLRAWLRRTLKQAAPTAKPQDLAAYAPDAYAARLQHLYASVTEAKPAAPEYVPKHKVLNQFLKPGSFHFLCT